MMDGQPLDFMAMGNMEIVTDIRKDGDVYVASAYGIEARHTSQEQAINDLNLKVEQAVLEGTLRPDYN